MNFKRIRAVSVFVVGLLLSFLLLRISNITGHAATATPLPNTDVAKLTAILQAQKQETNVKTLLFGMWIDDREVLTTALGDSMTNVPATPEMHFRIGGVSEMFLTTLLLRLAEQKVLGLDDKLSTWFPSVPQAERVTLRMLANNTAGYKDYVYNPKFVQDFETNPFRQFQSLELIDYAIADGQLNFAPGSDSKYSHTDFVLLAEVVQKKTGKSLEQLYAKQIFQPLGLTDTMQPLTADIKPPVLHAFVPDRLDKGLYEESTFWNPSWAAPYGTLISNLKDLSKWAKAFGTGALLTPQSFQEQTKPPASYAKNKTSEPYFAMGFGVVNGWFIQNPDLNGYIGLFAYNPSKKLTIVVETTLSETNNPTTQYSTSIFKEVLKYVAPDAIPNWAQ